MSAAPEHREDPRPRLRGLALRNAGYNAGRAGKPPEFPDEPAYMLSYRRGKEAKERGG